MAAAKIAHRGLKSDVTSKVTALRVDRLMTELTFDSVKKKRTLARVRQQAPDMQDDTLPAFGLCFIDEVVHSGLLS